MAEIYIHIPFCVKKCKYCDFNSGVYSDEIKSVYTNSLIEEIKNDRMLKADSEIKTIYFGGGTPSVLKTNHIESILEAVYDRYSVDKNAEITIEVNPGTVDETKFKNYRGIGINRISMGIQSLEDKELAMLGRVHDAKTAEKCFEGARRAGFDNISTDIMSSLPGQSIETLEATAKKIIALKPEHISAYSLILEEGTAFYDLVSNNELTMLDEDISADMDEFLSDFLVDNGYERYEISNYALKGFESRHNSGYWKREIYRGFGMGAASFDGAVRFSAEMSISEYLSDCCLEFKDRKSAAEYRVLTKTDAMEEFMFLGLRRMAGISFEEFKSCFGFDINEVYGQVLDKYYDMKLLTYWENKNDRGCKFTKKGIQLSNTVLAEFLL